MWALFESTGDATAPDLYFEAGSLMDGKGGKTVRTLSSCHFKAGHLAAVAIGEEIKL